MNHSRISPAAIVLLGPLVVLVGTVRIAAGQSVSPQVSPVTPLKIAPPATAPASPPAPAAAPAPARVPAQHTRAGADLSGCNPDKDISCTVIRETPGGTVVTTVVYRKNGPMPVIWSPQNGTTPVSGSGTICVGRSNEKSYVMMLPNPLPNDAPILD